MNLKILCCVIFSPVHLRACLPCYSMYIYVDHSSQFIDIVSFDFKLRITVHIPFLPKGPFLVRA